MPATTTHHFLGINWQVSPDHRSDTWAFAAYWLLASPLMLASFGGSDWTAVGKASYYGYMVVTNTVAAWVIVNVVFHNLLSRRRYVAAMTVLLAMLIVVSTGTYALDVYFFDIQKSYWRTTLNDNLGNDAQNVLTLVAILAAKKFFDERQRNTALESERRQSELQRLRAQVDPHFLFNSLNILDILIEDNPDEARHFVHRLSNLYRYLIRHRDEDLVAAAEEVDHARDYRYLIERRFGNTFRFRENFVAEDLQGFYLPPGALQTVLENIFKHNVATASALVQVELSLVGKTLTIANDYRSKPARAIGTANLESSGSGLENLRRRIALMSDSDLTAGLDGERWAVSIPLVTTAPASPTPQDRDSESRAAQTSFA